MASHTFDLGLGAADPFRDAGEDLDPEPSAADAFELEMSEELERRVKEADEGNVSSANKYEDIYFDSDNEEEEEGAKDNKRRVQTNDDLFYDPDEDDKHQEYFDELRRDYHQGRKRDR